MKKAKDNPRMSLSSVRRDLLTGNRFLSVEQYWNKYRAGNAVYLGADEFDISCGRFVADGVSRHTLGAPVLDYFGNPYVGGVVDSHGRRTA